MVGEGLGCWASVVRVHADVRNVTLSKGVKEKGVRSWKSRMAKLETMRIF